MNLAASHSVTSEARHAQLEGAAPVEPTQLSELSDADLLSATRLLVGRSNQLLASLLAHLAELEARGIHRSRACASLYTYCIYELRLSEDEAYRRVSAARLVRRFPSLLPTVAAGELHLTGLLMLGPHLTEANLVDVLARAKHRTKKEIARLVRLLDPLPDVPSRIEPLGPAPARVVPGAATWSAFVQSTCPVRELPPGDRPSDWMESVPAGADESIGANEPIGANEAEAPGPDVVQADERQASLDVSVEALPGADSDRESERLATERYSVQFTASAEYVDLVDRARALLSHSTPRLTLDELHVRALRALVTELERQKYAVTSRPRKHSGVDSHEEQLKTPAYPNEGEAGDPTALPVENQLAHADTEIARVDTGTERKSERKEPRQRGRHVPAAIRRAVYERDQGRCTYTDASGRRCSETHALELHHLLAFARGGQHTVVNLCLRCRTHNVLAAEEDFGKEFIQHARGSNDHDPWPK